MAAYREAKIQAVCLRPETELKAWSYTTAPPAMPLAPELDLVRELMASQTTTEQRYPPLIPLKVFPPGEELQPGKPEHWDSVDGNSHLPPLRTEEKEMMNFPVY